MLPDTSVEAMVDRIKKDYLGHVEVICGGLYLSNILRSPFLVKYDCLHTCHYLIPSTTMQINHIQIANAHFVRMVPDVVGSRHMPTYHLYLVCMQHKHATCCLVPCRHYYSSTQSKHAHIQPLLNGMI